MDSGYAPAQEAFRQEFREWLRVNLPEHRTLYPPSDDELSLHYHYLDRLLELAREGDIASRDPVLRQRLADLAIAGRALRLTSLRYITRDLRGEPPTAQGSVLKVTLSETYRQMAETAAQILGPYAQLWGEQPWAPERGRWAFQSLFALRFGIAGGTTEVQKNIIGERLLGLPK